MNVTSLLVTKKAGKGGEHLSPAAADGVVVTFVGRTSAEPIILPRCKGNTSFCNTQEVSSILTYFRNTFFS